MDLVTEYIAFVLDQREDTDHDRFVVYMQMTHAQISEADRRLDSYNQLRRSVQEQQGIWWDREERRWYVG